MSLRVFLTIHLPGKQRLNLFIYVLKLFSQLLSTQRRLFPIKDLLCIFSISKGIKHAVQQIRRFRLKWACFVLKRYQGQNTIWPSLTCFSGYSIIRLYCVHEGKLMNSGGAGVWNLFLVSSPCLHIMTQKIIVQFDTRRTSSIPSNDNN